MSADDSESEYCIQLTLTCLYNVCRDWASSKPSQPGNGNYILQRVAKKMQKKVAPDIFLQVKLCFDVIVLIT